MICPYCKETILEEAIKCKHCGSMLNLDPANSIHTVKDEKIAAKN